MRRLTLTVVAVCVALNSFGAIAVDEGGEIPLIALSQVGYNTSAPKRFTAPGVEDGAVFQITREGDTEVLFEAKIAKQIGDFSTFRPPDSLDSYVVRIPSKAETSFPFAIRQNLYQEQFWQSALNFMIDCRSVVGTHPSAFGGAPWRDGTYYSYEVPSLLWLYAQDPAFWERAPRQINWRSDKARVLSPKFVYDDQNPQSGGVMEAVHRYFSELEPPRDNAPDIIKLVHWGLGFYLMKPSTQDWSNDPLPKQIHSQTVEQFAHLIYHWDRLKLDRWLPQSFYEACLAFAKQHWESSGCFEVNPMWDPKTYSKPMLKDGKLVLDPGLHPYKGRHAPGHSILPNLFMYLTLRDADPVTAGRHLEAARWQTRYIMNNLDWNDPRTTKGHRGSEFQTMLNLAWFLRNVPSQAPDGLKEKIRQWGEVVVKRSDNMWDFRRYDPNGSWTVPEMNEPGNLAGFPAAAIAAAAVIDDAKLANRLRELAWSHADNLWGRNPKRAAASARPERGYPLVERGWPKRHPDGKCARLELCRGGIDASPGNEMYPDNPNGEYRWVEGWVNWNAAWNVGLAMLQRADAVIAPPTPKKAASVK